jgi:hypothetical protein
MTTMTMMMTMMKKKSIQFYVSLYETADRLYVEDRKRIRRENKVLKSKCLVSQAIAAVQEYLQIFSFIRAVSDQKSKCFRLEDRRSLAGITAGRTNRPDEVSTSLLPNRHRREGFSCKLRRLDLKISNFYRSKSSCTWLQWKRYLICRGHVSITSGR